MTDHEKEILDKIKQSTEKTPVPESLAPDQIMNCLLYTSDAADD